MQDRVRRVQLALDRIDRVNREELEATAKVSSWLRRALEPVLPNVMPRGLDTLPGGLHLHTSHALSLHACSSSLAGTSSCKRLRCSLAAHSRLMKDRM